jgi:hypothetical protein
MNRYMATQEAIQPQGQDAIGMGAARGIDAARTSLSLTPNISRPSAMARAIGGGAAAFKAPQPGTGQAGMLNSIAQAMGPAMQEYYREMDTRNALEMQMAEAQQKQQNEMMDRDYRQQVLGETSRHHRAIEAEQYYKRQQEGPQITEEGIDISGYTPIPNRGNALVKINQEKSAMAKALKSLNNIKKHRAELDSLTKDDTISQSAPYGVGKVSNAIKDFYGRTSSSKDAKKTREITIARKNLERETNEFRVISETALKGGGALAQGMYDRMTSLGLYPEANDAGDEFYSKVSRIEEKMVPEYKALKYSAKYKKFIDPIEFEKMHGTPEEELADEVSGVKKPVSISEIRKRYPQFADPNQFPDAAILEFGQQPGI